MSNPCTVVDENERRKFLRKKWREENITSLRREFARLSQEIGELLELDAASEEEIFILVDTAHDHLAQIRPYFPVIADSEVKRYEKIAARFHAWQRAIDHGGSPDEERKGCAKDG